MGNLEAKNITITSREEAIQAHEALRKYIFEKIENDEFEVMEVDAYRVIALIDGYFKQAVWIANGKESVSFNDALGYTDINFKRLADDEKELLWNKFAIGRKDDIKAKKLEAIEKLQNDITELENN